MEYVVRWVIELDAESPEEAAKLALAIQRDTASIATHFTVKDEQGMETEEIGRASCRERV